MTLQAESDGPRDASIPLHDSPWFSMTYRVGLNILVMKRKSLAIDSLQEYEGECAKLELLMRDNSDVRGIVIDMRDVRARQDSEYEQATSKLSQTTFTLFPKIAMLFRSAAGTLQMRRFAGDRGEQLLSTTDERAAFTFASGKPPSVRPPG